MKLEFDAAPDELAVFLEEADEQLMLLDRDILALEKEGTNRELLQEIFRAVHTLKGSSGAIGHHRMASLTHALESVLDALRNGKLDATTSLIDLLLQGLDALRVLKEEVVTGEHSGLDPSALVESLNQVISEGADDASKTPSDNICQPGKGKSSGIKRAVVCSTADQSNTANQICGHQFRISVFIDENSAFPAARSLQVCLALEDVGIIIESSPTREEIEAEKVAFELKVLLATAESSQRLKDLIMGIPEIAGVRIENVNVQEDVVVERDVFALSQSESDGALHTEDKSNELRHNRSQDDAQDRQAATRSIAASKTVRIDIERLDALMNLVGELVIDCTRLVQLASALQTISNGSEVAQNISETALHIQRVTDELQDRVMKARMFPVSSVFSRFPRMVRDLAQRSGKQIEFIVEGEETELDRSVIEEISDPLIHLLRNAIDHGIETPAERAEKGKQGVGVVRLTACHREGRIVMNVEDDGRGIDPDTIRRSAVEKGLFSAEAVARMSDREALEIIFTPGFSTAKQISDVSGRGVGMDIVRTNIHRLGGTVFVESWPGRGTRFTLELPLTLAIMDALLVNLGNNILAIPLASVTETLRVYWADTKSVNQERVMQLRGRVLPLISLKKALGLEETKASVDKAYVVVVGTDFDQVGIVVDSLVGEQQVVVKSLGKYIGDVKGVAGATILGDGRVALILDVPALVRRVAQNRAGMSAYV